MADTKKTVDAEKTKAAPPPALAPASESEDSAVQQLIAEQDIHRQNGDDAAVAAITERLAELGFRG